ncbi:MAG: PQQ-dependent sugar dehydrogenase [Myxococcales bacterium]|nr:PQQ-dependent sugar dehydrogenase [Myxococcales bacterium]
MIRIVMIVGLAGAACRSSSTEPARTAADATPVTVPQPPPLLAPEEPLASSIQTIHLVPLLGGLSQPVAVIALPTYKHGYLIVEKGGLLRLAVGESPRLAAKPVLDLTALVSKGTEQGLLGLALHPKFAKNRKLYVNFTDLEGATKVWELTANRDATAIDLASKRELLSIEQPYENHNGGHLVFGPEGDLYVGTGDGGAAGDPHGNAQNSASLLGKLLRLDVDGPIAAPAIVARGLRNPWRFDFDPGTQMWFIADVGQNRYESIYAVAHESLQGANFGWNIAEGRHCFLTPQCDLSGFVAPLTDYSHAEGCSVSGGVAFTSRYYPSHGGGHPIFFYADFCKPLLRSLTWDSKWPRWHHLDWSGWLASQATVPANIVAFGKSSTGELLILSLDGTIYQMSYRMPQPAAPQPTT